MLGAAVAAAVNPWDFFSLEGSVRCSIQFISTLEDKLNSIQLLPLLLLLLLLLRLSWETTYYLLHVSLIESQQQSLNNFTS